MPDLNYDDLFAGLDGPRPLPSELADRLTATLAPTAVPRPLRRRIERVLAPALPVWRRPAVLAAAAVILVLLGTSVPLATRDQGAQRLETAGPTTSTTAGEAAPRRGSATSAAVASAPAAGPAGRAPSAGTPSAAPSASTTKRHPPFATGAGDEYPSSKASASPQATAAEGSSADASGRSSSSTGAGPTARIGIIGGDPAQERGFRAYVELANAAGGLSGRHIDLVSSGTSTPAAGVLVTVNLSESHVAGWRGGPLVETLNVTEAQLKGDVFGLAGSADRQARLAADAAFPAMSPGASAVIYVGGQGPWSSIVPDAIESVLRSRAVSVSRVAVEVDRPIVLAPADAAFLSLDPKRVLRFADASADGGYRARLGIWGIWSSYVDGTRMPSGTRALSPWQPPSSNEARAMADYAPGARSAGLLHGWAVAKSVAVALDNQDADSPAEAAAGLRRLAGFDPLLAPPYEFRPSTNSRTPDARLFELSGSVFTPRGEWRRDPRQ